VLAAGGFDERFIRAQDIELARRLAKSGLRFYFDANAVIHHEPDKTLDTWLLLAFKRGQHHFVLEREGGTAGFTALRADWHKRHRLSRILARGCVGHSRRTRLAARLLRPALAGWVPRRIAHLTCSALFCVMYWNGVADASGLGSALWRNLIDAPGEIEPIRSRAD